MDQDTLKLKLRQLVDYAKDNLSLRAEDEAFVTNSLLSTFSLGAPAQQSAPYGDFQSDIVDPIVEYAVQNGMAKDEERLLFETKLLGIVTPAPSSVVDKFDTIAANKGVKAATDWLFELSVNNNYIRKVDIQKNIKWEHVGKFGKIGITINLSKPEKDPKQIALAKLMPKTGYPSCLLCPENVGYAGNLNHPARQTLRIIPIKLGGEDWSIQYSPYQYYNEHIIALSNEHRPMLVNSDTLYRLLDFVDTFPHYFIGSNAALPIVGGSILTHDHYQGGSKVLPMFEAGIRKNYVGNKYKNVSISIADWYNSVVRVSGKNKFEVHEVASDILNCWANWTDESVNVICNTGEQHNAVTPIARKEGGDYIIDMILRNNRTDEAHPYGIFHPEEKLHNIKKEGIGIIEVMGLFILPGRLKAELEVIKDYICGNKNIDFKELNDTENPMYKHAQTIIQLVNDHGDNRDRAYADRVVTDYVNNACEQILECTAVFKNDEKGQTAFEKFIEQGMGFKLV
ncbi:MAG: UDP-glucose--hexose-1-phosphate uridylyltransferase [Clostridia bacterium]|jgi:UDPglucose--hexose-1-phosphate uridylyltransferase|nr:UDP-glucose--hexose-1-phosphate uridylyltransferase [Clostridia bacterium]MCI9290615.1 UDP-glucose--hexose-1-phosphate uridylyltransferase [Clostridia bacterium]MDE6884485.1 UDP-glucose--hexose-1-phosphate uridylyltransferase [Clostridia bacterium]